MKFGKLSYRALVLFSALAITGCASSPTIVQLSSQFDKTAAENLLVDGINSVQGNALIRQQGGGVVTCAGNEVYFFPVTEYATERMMYIYRSNQKGYRRFGNYKFVPDIQDYQRLSKVTQCDAQGDFEFENLADGDFYIVTQIFWMVSYNRNGGFLMKRVKLSGGETEKIVLTP